MPLHRIALALAAASLAGTAAAQATIRCPFIRPPGLAAEQVDAAVLQEVAQVLQHAPEGLDRDKSLRKLHDAPDVGERFAAMAQGVGETLGFDAAARFEAAARAQGGAKPEDALSVAQLQEIARKAYAAGKDQPPPAALAGAAYPLEGLAVKTPVPATGWSLLRCTGEQVLFQRRDAALSTALVTLAAVPPFDDKAAFEQRVRDAIRGGLPPGLAVDTMKVVVVDGEKAPCANALVTGSVRGAAFGMLERVCYLGPDAPFAWNTVFSRLGDGFELPSAIKEADAFVAGASPK
jgi:hypothetical protein